MASSANLHYWHCFKYAHREKGTLEWSRIFRGTCFFWLQSFRHMAVNSNALFCLNYHIERRSPTGCRLLWSTCIRESLFATYYAILTFLTLSTMRHQFPMWKKVDSFFVCGLYVLNPLIVHTHYTRTSICHNFLESLNGIDWKSSRRRVK